MKTALERIKERIVAARLAYQRTGPLATPEQMQLDALERALEALVILADGRGGEHTAACAIDDIADKLEGKQ